MQYIAVDVGSARKRDGHTPRSAVIGRPRVVFVGGLDRIESALVSFGDALGIDVEVHNGGHSGPATERLAALVRRTDVLVLVTGVNSHNAVSFAKREAAK